MVQHFLNNGQSSFAAADVIITPLPFEGAISYMSGAALGPEAILKASAQVELFDFEDKIDLSATKIHTLPMEAPFQTYKEVELYVHSVIAQMEVSRQFYLGLGGDHTVTIPAVSALQQKLGSFGIVQIDAHADMRHELDGNPYSHACIMRRIAEILGPDKILSIGIRAVSEEESNYLQENKVLHMAGNRSLHDDLIPEFLEKIHRLPEKIFLTVDLDGLDPTIMPHVGTPVPGGLSWHQVNGIIRKLFERKTVIAADVVEIASSTNSERSDFAAALLSQKIISQFVKRL